MTKKPKSLKLSLAAHRRIEKSYRLGVFLHAGFTTLAGVLLALTILLDWHCAFLLVFVIAVISSLVGLLADINALSDRRKIIAELVAQIEDAGCPDQDQR